TVLDLDQLSKVEGVNWIWKGETCLEPEGRLCLVRLSNGGKDAVEIREYDTSTKRVVEGGFRLTEGKQYVEGIEKDTLIVGREWTPGELTKSGYPYVLKLLRRGQPLDQAKEVFRGQKTDVGTRPITLRDADGALRALLVSRSLSFFEYEHW